MADATAERAERAERAAIGLPVADRLVPVAVVVAASTPPARTIDVSETTTGASGTEPNRRMADASRR